MPRLVGLILPGSNPDRANGAIRPWQRVHPEAERPTAGAIATVHDPRARRGRRHLLVAILAMAPTEAKMALLLTFGLAVGMLRASDLQIHLALRAEPGCGLNNYLRAGLVYAAWGHKGTFLTF